MSCGRYLLTSDRAFEEKVATDSMLRCALTRSIALLDIIMLDWWTVSTRRQMTVKVGDYRAAVDAG